jgi:Double-GTPase 2
VPQNNTATHVVSDVAVCIVGISALTAIGIFIAAVVIAYVMPKAKAPVRQMRDGQQLDPAWPNYLRGQHQDDFQRFSSTAGSLYRGAFKRWWAKFPLLVVSWPVLAVAAPLLLLLIFAFWLALLIVKLAGDVLFGIATGLVQLVDGLYARLKHTEASCPACFSVMDRPAYACPECGSLHRDIRAGRLGSFFRVCTCGRRLPTTVLRAAWQLDAVCQQCGAPVHRGAAVLTDVRVPVFGEPHAGKTRLIFAGINDILGQAKKAGLAVSFPDKASRERAEFGLKQITCGQRTVKTEWQLEPALTCQIGSGIKGALLHAFDAAGERFRGADGHDDLRYLDDGHTLVFVVDPFAVPGVRQVVGSQPRSDLLNEHLLSEPRNPEDAYGEVVSRVLASGTQIKKQRLAVVVSKADVLAKVGVAPPSESEAIKTWLHNAGLHNLVLAAGREFKEVRYFSVASVESRRSQPGWPASAPFVWAMASRGFALLGASVKPAAKAGVR